MSCAGVLADQRFAKNPSMEFVFRTSTFFYVFMNTRYISVIQFKNLISTLNTDLIKLIQKIIDKTGIKQLHSTCRGWGVDATGMGERVSFQVSDEDGDRYRSVSVDRIKKFVQICG